MPATQAVRRGYDATPRDGSTSRRHRPAERQAAMGRPAALLTIAEVLDELQVARSTFDTWRALGAAPECIKLPNGQLRIRRAALDAWLAGRIQAPAQAS